MSYDTRACVDKALRIVDLYAEKGIDPSRIYIKVGPGRGHGRRGQEIPRGWGTWSERGIVW